MTKVDVAETLVPAEAAVEDCPDVRDIALNYASVSPVSECAEDERLSIGVRSVPRLWKDGIGLPDNLLLLFP